MNKKLIVCILVSIMLFTGCGESNNKVKTSHDNSDDVADYKSNNDNSGDSDDVTHETGTYYFFDNGLIVRNNADGTITVYQLLGGIQGIRREIGDFNWNL